MRSCRGVFLRLTKKGDGYMKRALVLCGIVAVVGCGGGSDGGGAKGGSGGSGGTTGAGGTMSAGGTGGSGACVTGEEGCACYPNSTCNAGLACLSHLCVSLTGGAGTTGAGGSAT